ncbi:hypothetical protein MLD38_024013 [Melastoma candidum]|uniref:Uncharacterized protein n=1 Tax=Melastoma candidum TaxID=119954 RepID=A0ACB9NR19_9MYRT|nr:hypothetical protein MLD38_024013 [Melastoma candidum]
MPVIEDPSSSSSSSRRQGQGSHASGNFRGSSTPFLPSRFRGLGCAASDSARQVSVPEAIRASAEWERGRDKEREREREVGGRRKGRGLVVNGRRKKEGGFLRRVGVGGGNDGIDLISGCGSGHACGVVEDAAWCGMGVGVSGEVDFDVATAGGGGRRDSGGGGGRGRSDADRISQWERPSLRRPNVNPENLHLDFDHGLTHPRLPLDLYGSGLRRYRHVRRPSPEGLAEAMMLKTSLMMTEERVHVHDRYHGWRLDVDNMSYEQLLELGDMIGHVSTGLKEDEIRRCIRKIKISSLTGLAHILSNKADRKCSICQEEYEEEDDLGKLSCGHGYHMPCIKQWLSQKNTCPVCKSDVVPRT